MNSDYEIAQFDIKIRINNMVNMIQYPFSHLPNYDPYRDAGDEYYFNPKVAERYLKFIETELTFTKGKWKGKHFKLFDWQKDLICCLLGWLRISDDVRRYRSLFLYIPRKNGKSELIAAIADAIFFIESENDAEIYIGARDRGQALTLYNMANSMIRQNSDLSTECTSYATYKEIKAHWDNSKIQAISSDALSIHSLSPSVGIIDEVHAQPNGDLIEALETGMGAREQPLMILITTADIDQPSVCNEELENAKDIRDGKIIDPRYLPIIFETQQGADWRSEDVWAAANPSYPITPSYDFMLSSAKKAERSLRKLANFKRYNLNMKTSNITGWLNMDEWHKCKCDLSPKDMLGKSCFGALDLSLNRDMCNFSLLFDDIQELIDFPELDRKPHHQSEHSASSDKNRLAYSLHWFYVPKDAVENDRSGHYAEWVEEGYLAISGEKSVDYDDIENDILKATKNYNIKQIAFDPWNASQMAKRLEQQHGLEMVIYRQGIASINEPAKEFENNVADGLLKHNNPILTWQAGNVQIYEDNSGNIKPVKPNRDSPLKIDGIVTTIMATGLKILEDKDKGSIYDNSDIKTL